MTARQTLRDRVRWTRQNVILFAVCAALLAAWIHMLGFVTLHRYQPLRGTNTIDQLVNRPPVTFKFAVVRDGGRDYVVWIGMPQGALRSGPPVYVFDHMGTLVDRVGDVGDAGSAFIHRLYGEACQSASVTPEEALAFCRRARAARPPDPLP